MLSQRPEKDDSGAQTGTVTRVVQILTRVAEADDDVSIAGLAANLGLPRPTVHRLLALLRDEGLIEADPVSRHYRAGPEFIRVASLVAQKWSLTTLARPFLEEIVADCQETCVLGVYLPAQRRMMFADYVSSPHALTYRIETMTPLSVAWGASGLSILAFRDAEEIEAVLADAEPSPVNGRALPSGRTMLRRLQEIRRQGYASSLGQKIPEARGVAAPVRDASGRAVASLCLTVPQFRFQHDSEVRFAHAVMSRAKELSKLLGYRASERTSP